MKLRSLAVLTLAGCTYSTAPSQQSPVNGMWEGGAANMSLTVSLVENHNIVKGAGALLSPMIMTIRADGTFVSPYITVILSPGHTFSPFVMTGRLVADSMFGLVNGSGFVNDAMVLRRVRLADAVR